MCIAVILEVSHWVRFYTKILSNLLNNLVVLIIHRTAHGGSERPSNLRPPEGGKIWVQTQAHMIPKHGTSVPQPRYL